MRRLTVVAALVLSLGLAGCSSAHPPTHSSTGSSTPPTYPASLRSDLVTSCESGGGTAQVCQCTLRYFERHVSAKQFEADEAQVSTGAQPKDLTAAVRSCLN
jgi:hypothetical protein